MSEISRHGSGHLCANSWGSTEISSENAVISVYKKDVMGKTSNEMREYNEMPVSMIAKVHNSPAVQPWERICIAIMAEEFQDQIWSSMELLREKSQPLIFVSCLFFFFFPQTFYAPYEISSVTSAIFSLLKVSYFIQLLGYQSVCAWYPAFPKPNLSFACAPVDVAVPAVGHLCCSLAICVVIGNGWKFYTGWVCYIYSHLVKWILNALFLFISTYVVTVQWGGNISNIIQGVYFRSEYWHLSKLRFLNAQNNFLIM